MQWRLVEQAAAETATGFKRKSGWVVPHSHPIDTGRAAPGVDCVPRPFVGSA